MTVRQVLNATQPHADAPFTFDGAEMSQVTLVAWIRSLSRNATNVQYTLDDGTGQLDVRQWIDNSLDEGAQAEAFAYVTELTTGRTSLCVCWATLSPSTTSAASRRRPSRAWKITTSTSSTNWT